jgi:hypothetical protein
MLVASDIPSGNKYKYTLYNKYNEVLQFNTIQNCKWLVSVVSTVCTCQTIQQ